MKTEPKEFRKFHKLLMKTAPKSYSPWYFPVVKNGKAPDPFAIKKLAHEKSAEKYSWKAKHAKLTFKEAIKRLEDGNNVGISARSFDNLHITDIDDIEKANNNKMPGLQIKSRKRIGYHYFNWMKKEEKSNIPTDYGEIRSKDQYVVAPGSYVPTYEKELKKIVEKGEITEEQKLEILDDESLGNYTVNNNKSPEWITKKDFPKFFIEQQKKNDETKNKAQINVKKIQFDNENKSKLFKLKITDIVSTREGRREGHPLHESDTGMNWCIKDGLGHCWRHLVSINAIQFLVIKSGYASCIDAGTKHKEGTCNIKGDPGAVFYAWLEAKRMNLIPENDKIPINALWYIAKKHGLIEKMKLNEMIPYNIYKKAIHIVEEKY